MFVEIKVALLHAPVFHYCSSNMILLSHNHTNRPAWSVRLVAAELYRQHLVHQSLATIQLHAAATTAAACITVLDDASLGGKSATYL